jgi:uncharacterized protein (TIGR02646 family)
MMFVDFNGKTPVNTSAIASIPKFKPWTQKRWDKWLKDSKVHYDHIADLHRLGKTKERNAYIDRKSAHWGKLKEWLTVLSHGKCWFSEVKELYSHYDIEHFRPKKLTKEIDGTERDGYWWLAFDSTNYRLCGNVGNRKKGNWFPIRPGSLISSAENRCEESEVVYLLDPTDQYDVSLIAYNEEGNAIPAPGVEAWEAERVEETIKCLKLNEHEPLTEARRRIWQTVSREIEQYLTAKKRSTRSVNPVATQNVRDHLCKIRSMTRESEELASVAKWCVSFRNNPQLSQIAA